QAVDRRGARGTACAPRALRRIQSPLRPRDDFWIAHGGQCGIHLVFHAASGEMAVMAAGLVGGPKRWIWVLRAARRLSVPRAAALAAPAPRHWRTRAARWSSTAATASRLSPPPPSCIGRPAPRSPPW